ncbi:hypothetical protein BJI67_01905 [Acidihalobacter aeolianus]|uniref:Regulator SirB n=1 Tax=Acidihalobacter aeolianus TaxID=2792603 RepID=A0A1D8K4V7_9GAMM|nr:SirB2 family protein [Acidihalobacter aeolianus]AOV15991.1 hypothetical protein BJI67_01905 [Acidihalobacter aeolianus]
MDWLLKTHLTSAMLSLGGFVTRGVWMMRGSPRLRAPLTRVLPHVIDTVLLVSGIWLALRLRLSPFQHPWFAAKLVAVVAYVILGAVALRRGRTRTVRTLAWFAALAVFIYIASVALSHRPMPFLPA